MAEMVPGLRVSRDKQDLRQLPLTEGASLRVGRDPECDLVLEGRRVSKVHLSLSYSRGKLAVEDLGSLFGIQYQGKTVRSLLLELGEGFELGGYRIGFEKIEGALEAPRGDTRGSIEAVLESLNHLLSGAGRGSTLTSFLGSVQKAFGADRCLLFQQVDEGFQLVEEGATPGAEAFNVSQRLLQQVLEEGEPQLFNTLDTVQLQQAYSSIGGELRSILVTPIQGKVDRWLLYLDSLEERRSYRESDRGVLAAYAKMAAEILDQVDARRQDSAKARRWSEIAKKSKAAGWIAESEAMQKVTQELLRAARTDVSILISGPSGTGKELAARQAHEHSLRAKGPFVAVNCAALPRDLVESELFGHEKGSFSGAEQSRPGLFELADKGTLFLDEIGELPLESQAKLLRAIQEKKIRRVGGRQDRAVDFRLVSATNIDFAAAVQEGSFREDLFYRISVYRLNLPPLCERGQDVLRLAESFLADAASRYGRPGLAWSKDARSRLLGYSWPGNIRQLQNLVEQLAIRSEEETISGEEVAAGLGQGGALRTAPATGSGLAIGSFSTDLREARREFEKLYFDHWLKAKQGNVTALSALFGMARKSLYARCKELGLSPEDYRGASEGD